MKQSVKILFFCFAFVGVALVGYTKSQPNIIFILADDLGKEWISAYGAEDIETPNIDALAESGMLFHNAYSMPQCTPSRATLLTGKHPYRTGYVNHWDVPRWGIAYFDWKQRQNTTFAHLLKDLGYNTAAAGKWQLNDFRLEPEAMRKHGFDDWAMWTGYETGVVPSKERYQDPYINTPEGSKTYKDKFGPDIYTDRLIAFMQTHKDEPFLLYYAMALPHTPFVSTPDEPEAETKLERHKAMTRYVDKMVGKIVDAVDALGLREKTIIIFTTDNGSTASVNGTRNGILVEGGKTDKTENGVCAPFIISAPGLVPEGVQTYALTDFADLLPTFVDLAGGEVPGDLAIDGVSIAPVILGEEEDSKRDWVLAMGHHPAILDEQGVRGREDFATRVIRDKEYKVWVSNEKEIIRLHNLIEDPWEKNNIIDSKEAEDLAALAKFQEIVDSLPDKDARPVYDPRTPNPWDKRIEP